MSVCVWSTALGLGKPSHSLQPHSCALPTPLILNGLFSSIPGQTTPTSHTISPSPSLDLPNTPMDPLDPTLILHVPPPTWSCLHHTALALVNSCTRPKTWAVWSSLECSKTLNSGEAHAGEILRGHCRNNHWRRVGGAHEIGGAPPKISTTDAAGSTWGWSLLTTLPLTDDTAGNICGQLLVAAGRRCCCWQDLQVVANLWLTLSPSLPLPPRLLWLPAGAPHLPLPRHHRRLRVVAMLR